MHVASSFSSRVRPVLEGRRGAVAAAHPLAVAAGQQILAAGGSAVDAAIAAQAVLCVVAPDACGLGGDMFALVAQVGGDKVAVNAAGAAPAALEQAQPDGGGSITVPGIVAGWTDMSAHWGRLPFAELFGPAIRIASGGLRVDTALAAAVSAQRARLERGGAGAWALMDLRPGDRFVQPRLADLLFAIAREGAPAFYHGPVADAVCAAVCRHGGWLAAADLAAHASDILAPLTVAYAGVEVSVQPPMAQGVLLAMTLAGMERLALPDVVTADHAGIELTEAAFAFRDCVARGEALLSEPLEIDLERAGLRGGPRAYLHTAGVATADDEGLVVSSLVSVFDDFGSCVFVPEHGFTLNNRAGGFTSGPNTAAPGKRPVHTLAPALVSTGSGLLALATPGADGQVQTLLQVIAAIFARGSDIAGAVAAPRWRSESGFVLIEEDHPSAAGLERLGHRLKPLPGGDMRFGSVVCSGILDGAPVAVADWRRNAWAGVC
jgi:gamma-glutamyltranspeptidase/glutathione hydrolase